MPQEFSVYTINHWDQFQDGMNYCRPPGIWY